MRAAAKQLEFERAAALRDEVQQIRLRVLEEDAVGDRRAGRRAGGSRRAAHDGGRGARATATRRRGAARPQPTAPALEVTTRHGPAAPRRSRPRPSRRADAIDEGTAADWLPGIRDEHDDDGGWQARWLDRPTWDRTVTPNVVKRTGSRPPRRRR